MWLSESKFVSFDYLENGDANQLLEKLKDVGYKVQEIFTISNSEQMMKKTDIPGLGQWIKKTINFEFQEKDPRNVFKEIIDTEEHLRISGVGCKRFKCKLSVNKVGNAYDSLIQEARRVR